MAHEVDINENIPHKVSEVVCLKCLYRWIATRPVGVRLRQLECPSCMCQGYVIETGDEAIFE